MARVAVHRDRSATVSFLAAMSTGDTTLGLTFGLTIGVIPRSTVRIHPAILAHATVTIALLLDGRFTKSVRSGEAPNEHILGDRWPPGRSPPRDARGGLEEAIAVVRTAWTARSTAGATPAAPVPPTADKVADVVDSGVDRVDFHQTGSGSTTSDPSAAEPTRT